MVLVSSFSVANSTASGTGCNAIEMGAQGYRKGAQLNEKMLNYLEQQYLENQSEVALIARVGSKSPIKRFKKKVSDYWKYTHGALTFRVAENQWSVIHLLNTCDQDSNVFTQNSVQFFMDDPFQYKVMVAIPTLELQQRLKTLLVERNMASAFFNDSRYSSVSSPFNTQRQNSNEYILDVLVAATAPENTVFTREQSKNYLNNSRLKLKVNAEIVEVGGFESFGINLGFGPDNATMDDHSKYERRSGRLKMVSVGTLFEFLVKTEQLKTHTELKLVNYHRANDTKRAGDKRN
jgi:hypothetical protein